MPPKNPANRKLFTAAKTGAAAAVRDALAQGADVTARDGNGWTALHEACRHGQLDACTALVAAGADPDARHAELGYTPLILAAFTPGNAAIVRALLAAGAAPSLPDAHGFTALHAAAAEGDLEALEALLAAGGDPDARAGTDQQAVVDRAPPQHAASVRALVARMRKAPR